MAGSRTHDQYKRPVHISLQYWTNPFIAESEIESWRIAEYISLAVKSKELTEFWNVSTASFIARSISPWRANSRGMRLHGAPLACSSLAIIINQRGLNVRLLSQRTICRWYWVISVTWQGSLYQLTTLQWERSGPIEPSFGDGLQAPLEEILRW